MSEQLAGDLDRDPLLEQRGGSRMAQPVEAHSGRPDGSDDWPQSLVSVAGIPECADVCGDDEVGLLPQLSRGEALSRLLVCLGSQLRRE